MRRCRRCVMPDTKPHLAFDADGICAACLAHETRGDRIAAIDWATREHEFDALIERARAADAPHYDVLVPVSGGKDSITQVHRVAGRGLRILAVNVDYGVKTDVGRRNLERIPEMGADLVVFRPSQPLHKRLIRIGLEDFGDPDLLSHTLLHAYPIHAALRHEIPLVLLGENSAEQYGGETDEAGTGDGAAGRTMTRAWFDRYAANQGRDARFIAGRYDIPFETLRLYDLPDGFEDARTEAVFMSHYFRWDSEGHLEIAIGHGFERLSHAAEGTYRDYVGIDEKIHRIHQYLKVLKFGYGRATDHACEDIRNGRLTREEALRLVREHDRLPVSVSILDDVAAYIGMTRDELVAAMEKYRNEGLREGAPAPVPAAAGR